MLASEPSAMANTTAAKQTRTIRIVRKSAHSSICGMASLITFSLRITDGANKVALEQLITAESTAPKNITWAKTRCVFDNQGRQRRVGNPVPGVRRISPGRPGVIPSAINIGTKQKQKYSAAPIREPRTAVRSSFALVMR